MKLTNFWGAGEYPVFNHPKTGKEYIGFLPDTEEEKGYFYYLLETGEHIQEKIVRRQLLPVKPEIPGYPSYFNVCVDNIQDIVILDN